MRIRSVISIQLLDLLLLLLLDTAAAAAIASAIASDTWHPLLLPNLLLLRLLLVLHILVLHRGVRRCVHEIT